MRWFGHMRYKRKKLVKHDATVDIKSDDVHYKGSEQMENWQTQV